MIGTATSEEGVKVINGILSESSGGGFGIQLDLSDKQSIENLFDIHYKQFASGISSPGRSFNISAFFN